MQEGLKFKVEAFLLHKLPFNTSKFGKQVMQRILGGEKGWKKKASGSFDFSG